MIYIHGFFLGDAGVTAVEYTLIAALITIALIAGLALFTPAISNLFASIAGHLNALT
ncbi:MAG: Flp family type IVb pilin [Proteobacteria bacterium]|nr:Flp family type IVb pilin [Pseudomonadota bacterium]